MEPKIPGFVWTAILALIPLLVQWLQGEYFAAQTWVSVAIIVLGALAKLLEVYRPAQPQARDMEPSSKARRFLLG